MFKISSFCLSALLTTAAVPAFAFASNASAASHENVAPQLVSMHSRMRAHRLHCNGRHNGNCRIYRKNF